MSDVTQILSVIERGEAHAAEQLLPLVCDELRLLAAKKMAHEPPGQTLEAMALVHEAYLRPVDRNCPQAWNSRGHFLPAAAEALNIATSTADSNWAYARSWLRLEMDGNAGRVPR